jgi:hypothetical protein
MLRGKIFLTLLFIISSGFALLARDIEFTEGEVKVFINPGEPTELRFPGSITVGYKKQGSSLSVDRQGNTLVLFAQSRVQPDGEVLLVRLADERSYSIRVLNAPSPDQRDSIVVIKDNRRPVISDEEEKLPQYRDRRFVYPSQYQVAGLVRELVLVSEFGKESIPGYRVSEAGKGTVVVNNGAIMARLVRMYLGPQLWGYVLEAENVTDEVVKIDPAIFKIAGTRAVSASSWELSAKPITAEQRLAGTHKSFVYVVTKAR